MNDLPQIVRRALDARRPTDAEAAADVRDVIERVHRRRARRRVTWALVPAVAGAVALGVVVLRPAPTRPGELSLYIRVDGEPDTAAVRLDLSLEERR